MEGIGFEFNPYDPCVANRIVSEKQQTVCFHFDDLKSSHKDPVVNDKFLVWLQEKYGQHKKVEAQRGDKHEYLGMILDYSTKGKVKNDMKRYVSDMLEEFPLKLNRENSIGYPAAKDLFGQQSEPRVEFDYGRWFPQYSRKRFVLTKRARPDIQPTCTRVQSPTQKDWKKLVRMMSSSTRPRKTALF